MLRVLTATSDLPFAAETWPASAASCPSCISLSLSGRIGASTLRGRSPKGLLFVLSDSEFQGDLRELQVFRAKLCCRQPPILTNLNPGPVRAPPSFPQHHTLSSTAGFQLHGSSELPMTSAGPPLPCMPSLHAFPSLASLRDAPLQLSLFFSPQMPRKPRRRLAEKWSCTFLLNPGTHAMQNYLSHLAPLVLIMLCLIPSPRAKSKRPLAEGSTCYTLVVPVPQNRYDAFFTRLCLVCAGHLVCYRLVSAPLACDIGHR